jgi:hypothetical protein
MLTGMDAAVQDYLRALRSDSRALFDRVHDLVLDVCPGVVVVMAYKMPTYVVGDRQLHVAVWKHGLSFYGWDDRHDGGFVARHPELSSGRGTLRLPHTEAGRISDDELRALVQGALAPLA